MFGGVSRQYVHKLVHRDDFPAPVEKTGDQHLWRREDVEAWKAERWPDRP